MPMKEYRVLVLTPEGDNQHTLTCEDTDEAKQCAKVLANTRPVEIWDGPVRIVRIEPKL